MAKALFDSELRNWSLLKEGDQKVLKDAILEYLGSEGTATALAGMKRFGIDTSNAYGISTPRIHAIANELKPISKVCSTLLWKSGVREGRLLACLLWEVEQLSRNELYQLPAGMNSWDVCDHACMHLLRSSEHRWSLVYDWIKDEAEFTRRSGFALVATMAAVRDSGLARDVARSGTDEQFSAWLQGPVIKYATDERNFVKKAVHWSIRAIGKRNATLWPQAINCAQTLVEHADANARWVGRESLKELKSKGRPTIASKKRTVVTVSTKVSTNNVKRSKTSKRLENNTDNNGDVRRSARLKKEK
ncbi:armadillo-type protein [Syncephalis fuscata]|nr:armadillo-type protein [Syncephalis fuscata]